MAKRKGPKAWASDDSDGDLSLVLDGDDEEMDDDEQSELEEEQQPSPPASKPAAKAGKGSRAAAAAPPAKLPAAKQRGQPVKQPAMAAAKPVKSSGAKQRQQQEASLAAAAARRLASKRGKDAAEPQKAGIRSGGKPAEQQKRQQAAGKKAGGGARDKAGWAAPQAASSDEETTSSGSKDEEPQQQRPGPKRQLAGKRKQPGAVGEPRQDVAADEEDSQEQQQQGKRPGKRQRGEALPPPAPQPALPAQQARQQSGGSSRKQQQPRVAALPAAGPKGKQPAGRPPTPVAAAAADQPLEMSAPPPSGGAKAPRPPSAAARKAEQQQQHGAAAAEWEAGEGVGAQAEQEEGAGQGFAEYASIADPAAATSDFLLRRLTMPRSREAGTMLLRPHLKEAHDALLDSLTNTVDLGHNNSLLVMGPRGSGKSLLVERALAALEARWNQDPRDPVVGVVRLTGLAHAEERAAFREVARQLCEVFKYSFSRGASVGENIEFLRGMLAALASSDKCAVFVLDEFDLFATKRSKQTLLYNLLDTLQTSGMQAAVVGLTVRQDVIEMLEKRVKSRFSHRKLDLSLPTSVMPVLPRPAEDGRPVQEAGQDGAMGVLQAMLTLPPEFPHRRYAAAWNASVEAAAVAREVRSRLQECINIYPSLRHLANIADVALARALAPAWLLGADAAPDRLAARQLLAAVDDQLRQRKGMVEVVAGLPILGLILLVAVHRVTARDAGDLNFEMAFHEYQRYTLHGGHVDTYEKPALAKVWDELLDAGLVAFVDPRSEARVATHPYAAAYLQLTREEVQEGMDAHWNCPHALKEWFKREGGVGSTAAQFF